ncbi:MAG: hypothetical protein GF333_07835 [Candidatus Omnitrophica bacterium]|nr:hypothetical protein [Candidatus Omnitrophota bacterium]
MRILWVGVCLWMSVIPSAYAAFQPVHGIDDAYIVDAEFSPFDPSVIYAASRNSLYVRAGGRERFDKLAVYKDEHVRRVICDPTVAGQIYVVTSRSVYLRDGTQEKVFSVPDEEQILSAAIEEKAIYVGTDQNLYYSGRGLRQWNTVKGMRENPVYGLTPAPAGMYCASAKGVLLLERARIVKRLFVFPSSEEEAFEEARVVHVDIANPQKIWLGTTRGLYLSEDGGGSWQKLYLPGMQSSAVADLAQTSLAAQFLYAATEHGVFQIHTGNRRVNVIYEGLVSSDVNAVIFAPEGVMYAATPRGFFRHAYFSPFDPPESLRKILVREPDIREVQEAVLRYNEISPEKIRRWRNSVRYRALFPTVNLDYDKTIYGTAGGSSYDGKCFVGPRDWGVRLSWDVGDLIWNPYEDDIDTRSRLNTQLRLDVLDEINRVYFERLRLKMRLASGELTKEEYRKTHLRMRELTAILNGYTGGFFSRRCKELHER